MSNETIDKLMENRAEEYATRYLVSTKAGYPCGMYKNRNLAEEIAKEINGSLFYLGTIKNNSISLTYLGRFECYKFVEGGLIGE